METETTQLVFKFVRADYSSLYARGYLKHIYTPGTKHEAIDKEHLPLFCYSRENFPWCEWFDKPYFLGEWFPENKIVLCRATGKDRSVKRLDICYVGACSSSCDCDFVFPLSDLLFELSDIPDWSGPKIFAATSLEVIREISFEEVVSYLQDPKKEIVP